MFNKGKLLNYVLFILILLVIPSLVMTGYLILKIIPQIGDLLVRVRPLENPTIIILFEYYLVLLLLVFVSIILIRPFWVWYSMRINRIYIKELQVISEEYKRVIKQHNALVKTANDMMSHSAKYDMQVRRLTKTIQFTESRINYLRRRIDLNLTLFQKQINQFRKFVLTQFSGYVPELLNFLQMSIHSYLVIGFEDNPLPGILVSSISLFVFFVLIMWKSGYWTPRASAMAYTIIHLSIVLVGIKWGLLLKFPQIIYFILSLVTYILLMRRLHVEKQKEPEEVRVPGVKSMPNNPYLN